MWDYAIYADDVQMKSPQTVKDSLKQIEVNLKSAGKQGWEVADIKKFATNNPEIVIVVHYLKRQT